MRRGFGERTELLRDHGADTTLGAADSLAVALSAGDLEAAGRILKGCPDAVRTGNPEEDRLLADLAGRPATGPVPFLIAVGVPGLDDGTPLHQTAWFGQPANAKLLLEAGAPVDVVDRVHRSIPLHWAAHGSRHSGAAAGRLASCVAVTRLLLAAGATRRLPDQPDHARRLLTDASAEVAAVLREHGVA